MALHSSVNILNDHTRCLCNVASEQGRIDFDQDLEHVSIREIMTDVEVGLSLGKTIHPVLFNFTQMWVNGTSQMFTTIASHDWQLKGTGGNRGAYWIHPGDLGFILWCELVALIIAYPAFR